jgi:hypothetical protein
MFFPPLSFRTVAEMQWSSAAKKKNQLLWRWTRFCILTAVPRFRRLFFWAAASGDVLFNASGTALYVSQKNCWHEQRITQNSLSYTTKYARELK